MMLYQKIFFIGIFILTLSLNAEKFKIIEPVTKVDALAYKLKNILDGKVENPDDWSVYYQFEGPEDKGKEFKELLESYKNPLTEYGRVENYPKRFLQIIDFICNSSDKYKLKPEIKDIKPLVDVLTEMEKNKENICKKPVFSYLTFSVGERYDRIMGGVMVVFYKKKKPIYMLSFYTSDPVVQKAIGLYHYDRIGILELKYADSGKISGMDCIILKIDDKLKKMTSELWKKLNIGICPKENPFRRRFYFLPMGLEKIMYLPEEFVIERLRTDLESTQILLSRRKRNLEALKEKKKELEEQGKRDEALELRIKELERALPKDFEYKKEKEEIKALKEKYKDKLRPSYLKILKKDNL